MRIFNFEVRCKVDEEVFHIRVKAVNKEHAKQLAQRKVPEASVMVVFKGEMVVDLGAIASC
jgi:hypothetical protein